MKHTANYKLNLPEYTDVVDVKNFNDNFEKIDTHLAGKLGFLGDVADADSAMETGMYSVHDSTAGLPEEHSGHIRGSLLVLNPPGMGEDGWCTQILTGYDYNNSAAVYCRRVYDDIHKNWTSWQATASAEDLESLQNTSVKERGSITVSNLSDFNKYIKSGVYLVRIMKEFDLNGNSDIQKGGGLLVVFGRNDHSALQLWLLLDETRQARKLYWRFLQTEGNSGEGYVLPTTNFYQFSGGADGWADG